MSMHRSLVTVGPGEVVKTLADWAGLLAPPLIASGSGMDVQHIPELRAPCLFAADRRSGGVLQLLPFLQRIGRH